MRRTAEGKSKSPGDSLFGLLLTILVGLVLDVLQQRDDLLHVTVSPNQIEAKPGSLNAYK